MEVLQTSEKNMVSKKDIRKIVLARRSQMATEEWAQKSHRIYESVITHPFFLESEEIYCYVDYRKEVETKKIIETAWKLGKKVAVPKVEADEMSFYYIHSFDELEEGYRQILEPISQEKADGMQGLLFMPGVAFDSMRNRIGYGKGFYDAYCKKHLLQKRIALGFELQLVEKIPAEPFDWKPDALITEEKIYV